MSIRTVEFEIEGVTPLQQSKEYASSTPKEKGETHSDFEKRTWRKRAHCDGDGNVFIPGIAFKKSVVEAAQYTAERIPGGGSKTWTQKFQSALLVEGDLMVGAKVDAMEGRWVFGSSNGLSGKAARVWKCFPTLRKWGGTVTMIMLDAVVSKTVMLKCFETAGQYVGVGTWRPKNGGEYGRFRVVNATWSGEWTEPDVIEAPKKKTRG